MLFILVEEYILGRYIDFTIIRASILFLPAGVAFLGGVVGAAMSKGFSLSNKKLKARGILLCALFGAVTFVGINFMEYKTTYVTKDKLGEYSTNRTFNGEPISGVVMKQGGKEVKVTFVNFIKDRLDNNNKIFRMKGGREIEVNSKGTVNYIMFGIDFLVTIIGAAGGSLFFIPAHFCKACNKYHFEKAVFYVGEEEINYIIKENNIIIDDHLDFSNFVNSHKKKLKGVVRYTGVLSYCKQCNNGKLIIKKFIKQGTKFKEVKSLQREIDIEKSIVEFLI